MWVRLARFSHFVRFVRLRAECWTVVEDRSDVSVVAVLRKWMYVIVLPFPCRRDKMEGFRAGHRHVRPGYVLRK